MRRRVREIAEAVSGTAFIVVVCTVVPVMLFVPVFRAVYPVLAG